jgi:hypothetical protein
MAGAMEEPPVEKDSGRLHKPYRVLMCGYPQANWFTAPAQDVEQLARPYLQAVLAKWEQLGARVIGSLFDDALTVGLSRADRPFCYLLFDVDSLDIVAAMVTSAYPLDSGTDLDTGMSWEARIGHPFLCHGRKLGAGQI